MKLRAPAKINLGLRIVGTRPDGYHELDSIFLPLDLADELEVETAPAGTTRVALSVAGDAPADASNLAARAARGFAEAAGLSLEVRITLRKHIPAAAGLGGGSSDAAAVLRALRALHPGTLDASALATLALSLGADVPFFLDPQPSRVGGIGERLEPLRGVPALALVLANPGAPIPTVEAFRAYDALGRAPSAGLGPLPDFRDPADLAQLTANDLEDPALRICPALGRLRRALQSAGAAAVGLSGSGATLYGVCQDPADARAVAERLPSGAVGWSRVAIAAKSR